MSAADLVHVEHVFLYHLGLLGLSPVLPISDLLAIILGRIQSTEFPLGRVRLAFGVNLTLSNWWVEP